jgi:hypothetical protein
MKQFKLQEEHLVLLKAAYVDWEHTEYGAPAIDPKRPYGNSDVEEDVCEILGWDISVKREDAADLHRETATALQVILTAQTFEPGLYEDARMSQYHRAVWRKVKK